MAEYEPCPKCGKDRLPARWYKPGYEWMGHSRPCVPETPVSTEGENRG